MLTLIVLITVPSVWAQPPSSDSVRSGYRGVIAGGGYLLAVSTGRFAEVVGTAHAGGNAFVGIQGERVALGLDVAGFTVSRQQETVRLESGPSVALETRTDFARIGLFGRYGPRFGLVYPYAEVLVGVNVFTTETTLAESAAESGGDTEWVDVTPAAGVGGGVMLEAGQLPFGFHLQGRITLGGSAHYRLFDEESGRFVEQTSPTTTTMLSLGVIFYPF